MTFGNVLARARVVLEGDTVKLQKALNGAQAAMRQAGSRMKRIGSDLTTKVTLPLVGVGVAGVKMAADFDASMRKIVGLVGVPQEQVDEWRDKVRELGVQYAISAKEAANALFFITSAGLRGDAALSTLEASLKGSAAGMGDVATLADAATSAMNAYGQENITAERAVEVLTAAVRAGKLETAELAPVIGRLLPTAAAMGVSFEQVSGLLAVFSRTGTQAAEGATSLNSVLTTLIKPAQAAQEALEGADLSMAQLRQVAAGPGGLVEAMRLLDETFKDDDEALSKIIPNVRAFRGVMNVLAQDTKVVDEIMGDVADSVGILQDAVDVATEGPLFRMRQAWERIKNSLIDIGEKTAPLVADALEKLSKAVASVVDWFQKLNPTLQVAIGAALGLTAALGPLLIVLGGLVGAIGAIKIGGLVAALTTLGGALLPTGLVIAGLSLAVTTFVRFRDAASEAEKTIKAADQALTNAFSKFNPISAAARLESLQGTIDRATDEIATLDRTIFAVNTGMGAYAQLSRRQRQDLAASLREEIDALRAQLEVWKERKRLLEATVATVPETPPSGERGGEGPGDIAARWLGPAKKALEELDKILATTVRMNEALGRSFSLPEARAEAYRMAIETLVEAGTPLNAQIGETGRTLAGLVDSYNMATAEINMITVAEEAFAEIQRRTNESVAAASHPVHAYAQAIKELNAQYALGDITKDQLKIRIAQETAVFQAAMRAFLKGKGIIKETTEETVKFGEAMQKAAGAALDSFLRFLSRGQQSFRDFVNQILADLRYLVLRFAASKFFSDVLKISVAGFAKGGYMEPGQIGLVGEVGPELAQPGRRPSADLSLVGTRGPELVQAGRQGLSIQPLRTRDVTMLTLQQQALAEALLSAPPQEALDMLLSPQLAEVPPIDIAAPPDIATEDASVAPLVTDIAQPDIAPPALNIAITVAEHLATSMSDDGLVGIDGPELVQAGPQGLQIEPLEAPDALASMFRQTKLDVPGFRRGGYLRAGAIGLVGEVAPELATAGRSRLGTVPMHGLIERAGTSGAPVNVNFTVQAVDARSFADLLEANPAAVTTPLMKAITRSRLLQGALLR